MDLDGKDSEGRITGVPYKGIDRVKHHVINRTAHRVHQSMEAFVHNMNTIHSLDGNQVVFSSINYGTDTSAEGCCIIRELLHTTYHGVGNGSTAIFPIQIWKKRGVATFLQTGTMIFTSLRVW